MEYSVFTWNLGAIRKLKSGLKKGSWKICSEKFQREHGRERGHWRWPLPSAMLRIWPLTFWNKA